MTTPYIFEGSVVQVNTWTDYDQRNQQIVGLADGGYVVTWDSWRQDLYGDGVYFQRYDANGLALGGEVKVGTNPHRDYIPTITAMVDGGFIIMRTAARPDIDYNAVFVMGQRYDANGVELGAEFYAGVSGAGEPSVTTLADGGFVVTWGTPKHLAISDSAGGIFGQRFDANSVPVGGVFHANTHTVNMQNTSVVTALSGGGFVVAWQSYLQDGDDGYGIFAQRFDPAGVKAGGEFKVDSSSANSQYAVSLTGLDDGGFMAFWESVDNVVSPSGGIFGQRYDASGIAVGGEFRVGDNTTGGQRPSTVTLADGGLIVVFTGQGGLYGQRFDADGVEIGALFYIHDDPLQANVSPVVAALADGGFAVSWININDADGDGTGIFARHFAGQIFGTSDSETIVDKVRANWIDGQGGNDVIKGKAGRDTLYGGAGDDMVFGGARRDVLQGGTGNDTLDGGTQNDILKGQAGNDTLIGGKGKDTMTGGSGADTFVFRVASDSATNSNADVITDFEVGLDHLDLTALGVTFIEDAGFSGAIEVRAVASGADMLVRVDVDGDGVADMKIVLEGVTGLTGADLLL